MRTMKKKAQAVRKVDGVEGFGTRVQIAAKVRGIAGNTLDIMTGQSKGQTSRLVNGVRTSSINLKALALYAEALKVDLRWLILGVGDMHKPEDGKAEAILPRRNGSPMPETQIRRRPVGIEPDDNIDVARRYHDNEFAKETIREVRQAAEQQGIDPASRPPSQWAVVLWDRELKRRGVRDARRRRAEAKSLAAVQAVTPITDKLVKLK